MAYATKEQDHLKRKTGTGSYSPYNHIYAYLMSNYEPEQDLSGVESWLQKEYKAYCIKCGIPYNKEAATQDISAALDNFVKNKGSHGDTANVLGKAQSNSVNSIASTLKDLKW